MVLQTEERKLFFKNWLKLLSFVNDKHGIVPNFGHPESPVGLDIQKVAKIRNKLWENTSIIDEYIKRSKLDITESSLVNSWKIYVKTNFLIFRELKNYCIFWDLKKNDLYGVIGITSRMSDTVSFLPYMAETVLIPFKDRIIYDGLLAGKNLSFGGNLKKSLNEEYSEIKKKKGIILELK